MAAQPQEEWEEVLLSLIAGQDDDQDLPGSADEHAMSTEGDDEDPGGRDEHTAVPAMVSAGQGPVARARAGLEGLGLSGESARDWVDLLVAQVAADGVEAAGVPVPSQDAEVLGAMAAMARSSAALEASLLVSIQDLVLSTGSRLLAEGNVQDPRSLSRTAHQTWRVCVKSAVAGELQVLLGVGIGQARRLVAIATYPAAIRGPILAALRRGEVTRPLVMAFQQATRRLEVEESARVSMALFGEDQDVAAVERLDAEGVLELGRPWHHTEYHAALKREVARAQAEDEDTAEAERAAAHQARDAQMVIDEDGTATLAVRMATVTGVAVMARIEDMARRARAGGDQRTLAQLRSDIIAILLLHGILTLPGDQPGHEPGGSTATHQGHATEPGGHDQGTFDQIVTPEDIDALRALITATPAGHVDLVIPWDAALGAVCPTCTNPTAAEPHASAPGPRESSAHHRAEPPPGDGAFDAPHSGCPAHAVCRTDGDADTSRTDRDAGVSDTNLSDTDRDADLSDTGIQAKGFVAGAAPGRVGELIGWQSAFITPRQARQIILTPGSLVGRLLYDPADGRCLERSIKRYAPDTDMRRQVRAADVYSRGPGSRRPAAQCELDHEKEWLTHGWTAEVNLNAKALIEHHRKTTKIWRSVMNRRRDLTWTTLLGQVASTRGHDYRQYHERVTALTPSAQSPTEGAADGAQDRADLAARRDLLNQLLYAAIVHRRPGERTEADDDLPGSEDWLTIGDWVTLAHTDQHGQRRRGGPPDQPTPEEVLGLTQGEPTHDPTGNSPVNHDSVNHDSVERASTNRDEDPRETPATDTPWGSEENQRPEDEPPPF